MLLVPFAFGLVLIMMSILGCCCSKEGNVCFLTFYGIIQFISGLFIVIAGSVIIVTINRYMYNTANEKRVSSGIDEGIGGAQRDFADFMLGLAQGCCSVTIPQCGVGAPLNQTGGYSFCWNDNSAFEAGTNAAAEGRDTYCDYETLLAACPEVNAFFRANYDFLNENVLPGGIALTIFGVILFLASFFSCHLGCKPEKTSKNYDRQAQNLNYGGNNQMALA
mmetsp:Transcript_16355/g.20233  ORF Transcript_16355/g.20233 Transcript_16355/m.20233 type:complete len:221 (+) Transcript_16355:628-1290(+)